MRKSLSPQQDNIKLAIFSILISVFALSLGDAVIKSMSLSFVLWQIYVIRSLIALPILLLILKWRQADAPLMPQSFKWVLIRSLLLACMWVAYYCALPNIKLSVAAAVYYTIPLFITLFSALFTGDKVTGKSWLAILIGFSGVLIIVRPDSQGFNAYVLLPLLAAIFYALAMILTRTKCLHENPKVLAINLNMTFIAMGIIATIIISVVQPSTQVKQLNPFLLSEWTQMDLNAWLVMAVLAIVITLGSLFAAMAYQNGPSSVVASFDYSYLVFSALWGLTFFAEVPDGLTLVGMSMIAGAGMIAVREER